MTRRYVLMLAVLLTTACWNAQTLPNGFYRISPNGVPAKALGGIETFLGAKVDIPVAQVTVESKNNENSLFSFTLRTRSGNVPETIALWVGGFAVPFDARGSGMLGATLPATPPEAMQTIAKLFGVKPRVRVKPPYTLSVTFVPAKPSFDSAKPVIVTLRIENTGSDSVAFQVGGRNRGPRDNQFDFTAYYLDGSLCDKITAWDLGGVGYKQALRPGEAFTREVDLRGWFKFSRTGSYRITGSYQLDFFQIYSDSSKSVSPDWFCIWADEARAPFDIRIR